MRVVWPLVLTLAACGGGGSSSGGGATPAPVANRPPGFTSSATGSTPENATGTVYTAAASDPDGDALTYSIASGPDAALFRITAAGALSFAAAPDFELPADQGANNIYDFTLSVADGRGGSATLTLAVTVTNAGPDAFQVRRVATGFAQPLALIAEPGAGGARVFVVEQGGRIRILIPATGAILATPFLDVSASILTGGEQGLLGLAFAPDYPTSRNFYIYVTNPAGDIEVRRYRAASADAADPASGDVVLRIAHPANTNHNGGWMEFGPDGFLYLGVGDGGGGGDPDDNAQNSTRLLGKLLRIDVASDAFPADPLRDYAIPASNPFASGTGGAPEVYALGLRNPFRASFDRMTGNLWIGDVGQNAIEEIDLLPASTPDLNFGWPIREGTQAFRGTTTATLTNPVTEYAQGTGDRAGRSVTGGYVYRGPVEALNGLYIFGDFVSGNLWSVPASRLVAGSTLAASAYIVRNTDFRPNAGTIGNIASFGVDSANNLYIVDYDGEIFRIEAM